MSAKAAACPVRGKNSTTCMIRIGQQLKLRQKSERTAEKNTLNGTLAKNSVEGKRKMPFL